jgi:hypothetical protein
MREPPTTTEETIIVHLWVRREEMNPDPKSPTQYPIEMKRKKDPASPCPICRSPSIAGSSGARAIRERKLRKKIPARKRSDGI